VIEGNTGFHVRPHHRQGQVILDGNREFPAIAGGGNAAGPVAKSIISALMDAPTPYLPNSSVARAE
jgi:hypothetical protein